MEACAKVAEDCGIQVANLNSPAQTVLSGSIAGVDQAKYLILTLPGLDRVIPVIQEARKLNPELKILVRAHYIADKKHLEEIGATSVVYEEVESAVGLSELLLRAEGAPAARLPRPAAARAGGREGRGSGGGEARTYCETGAIARGKVESWCYGQASKRKVARAKMLRRLHAVAVYRELC